MTKSRRLFVFSMIIVSAMSLAAYGIYLKRVDPTATDFSQRNPSTKHSADAQPAMQGEEPSVESDAVHRANISLGIDSSAASNETRQIDSVPVEIHFTQEPGDRGPEPEAPVRELTREVGYELGPHAYHDLLRFILEEEIQETGLDIEAARLLEASILEVAVALGRPSDVHLGVSDVQCTASLCTFLRDHRGTFFRMRLSPDWRAMEQQGPVPIFSWVGLGTGERQHHDRFYMFRPAIERHRDLLEAVVAGR